MSLNATLHLHLSCNYKSLWIKPAALHLICSSACKWGGAQSFTCIFTDSPSRHCLLHPLCSWLEIRSVLFFSCCHMLKTVCVCMCVWGVCLCQCVCGCTLAFFYTSYAFIYLSKSLSNSLGTIFLCPADTWLVGCVWLAVSVHCVWVLWVERQDPLLHSFSVSLQLSLLSAPLSPWSER